MPNDDFIITEIGAHSTSPDKWAKKNEFLNICQKSEWNEQDFIRLKELASISGVIPTNNLAVHKFSYYAINQAIRSGNDNSIQIALSLTDKIFSEDYNSQIYRPDENSPIGINKYKSAVDDLLYAHFINAEKLNPTKYITLYPQANIKSAAFLLLKDQPKCLALEHATEVKIIDQTSPNQKQLESIIRDLKGLGPARKISSIIRKMSDEDQIAEQPISTPDISYETDLSKYPGRSNAEIAIRFSNRYQLTALAMNLPPEESLKQNQHNIVMSLHTHKKAVDPTYRAIPDSPKEAIIKIQSRALGALAGLLTHKKKPTKLLPTSKSYVERILSEKQQTSNNEAIKTRN